MNERNEPHNPHEPDTMNEPLVDLMDPAVLARCAADDDLTDDQREALERVIVERPEIEQQIAFERELRRSVGRVMSAQGAPEVVRQQIREAIAAEPLTAGNRVETRRRSFWSRPVVQYAVAASMLLLAAAFLIPTSPLSPFQPTVSSPWGATAQASLISHLESEHERCAEFQEYFQRKLRVREVSEARAAAGEMLGSEPVELKLSEAGYEFVGLGACALPGPGRSVHLMYRAADGKHPPVSLFVQEDLDSVELSEQSCYCVAPEAPGREPVFCWRRDGLLYFLVSPSERAGADLRRAIGAPSAEVLVQAL